MSMSCSKLNSLNTLPCSSLEASTGIHPALIYLLGRVAFPHFNMRTVQQLTSRLAVPTQWCAAGDQVLLMVADIKEMYTGMLHSECVAAVQFVIDRCLERLRSPYISVSKCRHGPVFAGKSKAADMVVFPVAGLLQLVQFELCNLYFTVGTVIYRRSAAVT